MINLNTKIKIILAVSIVIIFIIATMMAFSLKQDSVPQPVLSPSPTPITLTTTTNTNTSPLSDSGAMMEDDIKYNQQHPDEKVEAQLRVRAPIKGDGFIVNFSYPKDKFVVTIDPPYSTNYTSFKSWFDKIGLKRLNQFEIVNK